MTSNAEPVNPLTGDLVTITVVRKKSDTAETAEVQARIIKPGLAITPRDPDKDKPGRPRFNLTHVPTGLAVQAGMCGVHVQEAASIAAQYPIDWTVGKDEIIAAIKATDLMEKTVWRCRDSYCAGDGQEPPTWEVRCHTCDWEWEDEYDEGPLDAKAAKWMADDHECEPEVQIKSPDTSRWHAPWVVNDDGTVRDLNASRPQPPVSAS